MDRILIANRGEIACRIIRSIQELGKQAIAVYSEADAEAPHRHLANAAYPIGPAPAPQSYLNTDAILQAAADSGAEAIHPGYGFLAENAAFATRCRDAGIVFIGPSPATMRRMGNKAAARQLAQDVGVPVIPGSGQQPLDLEAARKRAAEIGYPVLLKAASGGGGIGMQAVTDPESLEKAFSTAQNRAKSAFGRADLYLEKYLVSPRHIEVQILGDTHGNLLHLYERECSIQRRHQKVIEEAPSFHLAPPAQTALRDRMRQAALAVAAAVQYTNAGTVEFLLDEQDGFYFIEMNTRLQVEHTVTEMIIGADLVAEQIRIAEGQPLSWSQDDVQLNGAAIECRLYAENPGKNFFPSPGRISALRLPSGPGIRIDSGIADGAQITPYYDPLLAKIIAHGSNREAAICRMQSALADTLIEGLHTNLTLHQQILDHPQFQAGAVDTDFLMRMLNS
ncbi:MAG: acetyl-CoA carboxylase biotin carboxylase subunit [Candidatus Tectomicrobia bacterium]|nr:acetyl-CoA carboxylase biotin carboxylase subunit [Candidatus Tectomicrobia bacterium]